MSAVNAQLVVSGVSKEYPGTIALDSIDLEVEPGQIVALLGENGAGKSTLASVIAGVIQPSGGHMRWRGQEYAPTRPADAIAAGIGLIHQEMRLLPDLTVAENVLIGRWPMRGGLLDAKRMRALAQEQLGRLGFKGRVDTLVRELSVAGQQQVEIARALMLDASLLLLDEPTAALGEAETNALFECIRALRADGVSFIYVSHRLAEIARIADRIVVLRDGAKIAEHDSGDIDPGQLVREMVGRSVDRLFPEIAPPTEEVVISVRSLSDREGRFSDIEFDVHAGEVLGIAGIVGAGRTEVVRSIASLEQRRSGTVTIGGKSVPSNEVRAARDAGIVLIPEDRKTQGLIVPETIENNLALVNLDRLTRGGVIRFRDVRRFAREISERFGVKGNVNLPAASLSGGNQQKVVLAKWLSRDPRVIILDEPTRGIDVGARASIYEIIAELAAQGRAVIIVSSDLEEVLGLSHRVMVIADGRIRATLSAGEATADRVMQFAAG